MFGFFFVFFQMVHVPKIESHLFNVSFPILILNFSLPLPYPSSSISPFHPHPHSFSLSPLHHPTGASVTSTDAFTQATAQLGNLQSAFDRIDAAVKSRALDALSAAVGAAVALGLEHNAKYAEMINCLCIHIYRINPI